MLRFFHFAIHKQPMFQIILALRYSLPGFVQIWEEHWDVCAQCTCIEDDINVLETRSQFTWQTLRYQNVVYYVEIHVAIQDDPVNLITLTLHNDRCLDNFQQNRINIECMQSFNFF